MSKTNDSNFTVVADPSIQITKIKINAKEIVTIEATERVIVAPKDNEEESQERFNRHSITSDFPPDPSFLKALQGMKRFAMSVAEFNRKDIPLVNQFTVESVRVKGEQEKENSRIEFTLLKWVKRTGKGMKMPTGQTVMYDAADKSAITDIADMTKAFDALCAEAWEYMNGKNGHKVQLRFPFQLKKTA
jgi:hypothetical protein